VRTLALSLVHPEIHGFSPALTLSIRQAAGFRNVLAYSYGPVHNANPLMHQNRPYRQFSVRARKVTRESR